MAKMKVVTCTAPVNIAVVKYWGKRDEHLILPINDSISVTISSDHMHAKTTVAASPDFVKDCLWLNGVEEDIQANVRMKNCLAQVRSKVAQDADESEEQIPSKWRVHICSENNFPTAAGLASSAAGYACLVFALSKLYDLKCDISVLARQGSGSACRSVYGGFVHWEMGTLADGSDSIAKQLHGPDHFPDMEILICVVNDSRKKVASSKGMKLSTETSQLLKVRATEIVPERIRLMKQAIDDQDFARFGELTMRDSNQLHGVCLDTHPPCIYMNDVSHAVSDLVHQTNSLVGTLVASYTFDAGPNACLFVLKNSVPLLKDLLTHFFPPASESQTSYFRGEVSPGVMSSSAKDYIPKINLDVRPGAIKYIIHTKVGGGPKLLGEKEHLLNNDGLPKVKVG